MIYTIQQMKLARARGAEVEYMDGDGSWQPLSSDYNGPFFSDENYRLKNPEKDADLTRFDLYAFDYCRAWDSEICLTSQGDIWVRKPKPPGAYGEVYGIDVYMGRQSDEFLGIFNNAGAMHGGMGAITQLYMLHKPKEVVKDSLTTETKKKEPWQIILENYKREFRHMEWQAKREAGIELEYFLDGNWFTIEEYYSPAFNFSAYTKFREKPKTKKYTIWCVDYLEHHFQHSTLKVATFETEEQAVEFSQKVIEYKILSEVYKKEYEV